MHKSSCGRIDCAVIVLFAAVLLSLAACDTLGPDPPDLTTYIFTAEMTVEAQLTCTTRADTPGGSQGHSVTGMNGSAEGVTAPAFGVRVTCTGESDTGILRVELFADGDLVDTAETTTPSSGAVVQHENPLPD